MFSKDLRSLTKQNMLNSSLFRKTYILTLSFEMIAFLNIISLAVKSLVLCWGLFILIHDFFMEKRAFKLDHKNLFWAFLISMTLTSCVHFTVWFVPNLVIIYYTAVCFFIFYGMYTEQSLKESEQEMIFIFKFWTIFATVFGLLSLMLLLVKNEYTILGYNLGIFRNRLIGIYTNSNILAFSMVQSIVACDFLSNHYISARAGAKKPNVIFLIFCVVVNSVCLFLSDSNASFLFLIIYCAIRFFCNLFFREKNFKGLRLIKTLMIVMGFCLVMVSACFALRSVCQKFMSVIVNDVHRQERVVKNIIDGNNPNDLVKSVDEHIDSIIIQDEENSGTHIGRSHYEVSSGRITLLKQGIKIFKHNPIIGMGRANLLLYGKKYIKNGLIHPDLHNGYLTILVCYGLLGFGIFAIITLVVALDVCKHLFSSTGKSYFSVFKRLFSALVAYCGYCLFEKAILFDMTFMVGFFWLILGYTMAYIKSSKTDL